MTADVRAIWDGALAGKEWLGCVGMDFVGEAWRRESFALRLGEEARRQTPSDFLSAASLRVQEGGERACAGERGVAPVGCARGGGALADPGVRLGSARGGGALGKRIGVFGCQRGGAFLDIFRLGCGGWDQGRVLVVACDFRLPCL